MALMLDTASNAALASDHELIDAARAGDDRAFEELYARYSERIRVFILGRVRDHGRAEDIAQEVFMSALRRLRASSQEVAFKPWIYEIAKNACIDEHRRRRRMREVSLDGDVELIDGRRALLSLAPTPPAAVEGRQRLDDLRGAFGGLSDSHHKLLVMRELEGLSYDEIGRRTGMSRQMVESTLFRARRKLAEEYDELVSGRRCQHVQAVIETGRALSARSLGIRERRRLARHLAHCQPCRVHAHLAGVDESLLRPATIADKIAALLPFGLGKWLVRSGAGTKRALAKTGSHPAAVQSLQVATTMPDTTRAVSSLGGAAVAAAVIALAGAGGAIVAADAGPGHGRRTPGVVAPPSHRAGTERGASGRSSTPAGRASPAARRAGAVSSTSSPPQRAGGSRAASTSRGGHARSAPGSSPNGGTASSTPGVTHSADPGRQAATASHAASSTVHRAGSTVHKVPNAVKTTTRQTGKALSKTAHSVSKTVSATTKSVGNTVSSTASALGKTISSGTSALGKTMSSTGSPLGKTVSSTGSAVGNAVSSTGSAAGKTVSSAGSAVSNTVNGTASALTSGSGASSSGKSGGSAASAVTSTVKQAASTVSSTVSGLLR
jgi:RNA polymerase sigma factor (sigma-70 family)